MLAMVAAAGLFAQIINLPGIVGAFLAGLAVNAAVNEKPAKEKLEFVGNTFFVPIFFIVTGFLIDPPAFAASITGNFPLVAGIIGALLLGKFLAVEIAGRAFNYPGPARLTMWSLTLPQVAATLAAALVAYDTFDPAGHRLLDEPMLNAGTSPHADHCGSWPGANRALLAAHADGGWSARTKPQCHGRGQLGKDEKHANHKTTP